MQRTRPLDMPEIITLIGHCLPLWKYRTGLGFHDFNPSILLRCTLVNKTWRDALLPAIWYIYDGYVMRSIPKHIIIKNSRFFRVFFYDRSFSGPFESRHLKVLAISWWDQSLLPLIEANAESLENLSWKGSSSPSPMRTITLPSPDYDLFMRMASTLEELQLSHWTLSGRKFEQFLSACRRLTHLSLTAVDWTDPVPMDSPLHLSSSSPSSWSTSSSVDSLYGHHEYAGQGLTDLRLDISVSKEGAFVDLVRSCPDLENFSLYSESVEDPQALIPILRECCPKLSGIEYMLRFSSALGRYDYLSDTEYADLVLSAHRLQSLKIDIPWLDDAMTSALIAQSSTLASLSLRLHERRAVPMRDAENICKVLQHCIRLKHFSLSFNPQALGRDETLRLFEEPWKCVELETLELTNVTMAMDHGSPSAANDSQGSSLQQYHWQLASAPRPISVDATGGPEGSGGGIGGGAPRYGSLTKQRLFEQVRRLPTLAKLSLNHVTYTVDGFT